VEHTLKQPSAVLRICVSKAKIVDWNGNQVATGIFKLPVSGKVTVRRLNLDGDEQADLTVHGGPDKAVYAYPIEQYEYWKKDAPEREWDWGSFGENLTVSGFDENSVCIGDKLTIGTAHFVVTQPRMPCFKLGIRLADSSMVKRFYKSGKWGFYLKVVQEGEIETGDEILTQGGDGSGVSLSDVSQCFINPRVEPALLARVLNSNLAAQMKDHLQYQSSRNKR
jgi:MOSC domain-containing protein YiiM